MPSHVFHWCFTLKSKFSERFEPDKRFVSERSSDNSRLQLATTGALRMERGPVLRCRPRSNNVDELLRAAFNWPNKVDFGQARFCLAIGCEEITIASKDSRPSGEVRPSFRFGASELEMEQISSGFRICGSKVIGPTTISILLFLSCEFLASCRLASASWGQPGIRVISRYNKTLTAKEAACLCKFGRKINVDCRNRGGI